jgi:hypothetical protein
MFDVLTSVGESKRAYLGNIAGAEPDRDAASG